MEINVIILTKLFNNFGFSER